MRVDLIRPRELSRDLAELWRKTQETDVDLSSPFLHPEFSVAVGQSRDDVEIALIQDHREIVGFFPFHRDRRNIGRPVGLWLSDLHGAITRPEYIWRAQDLMRHCELKAWHFDCLIASQRAFEPHHIIRHASPYLDLSGGFDEYALGRRRAGSNVIAQTERKARKLGREIGPVHLEFHTTDREVFERILQWKSHGHKREDTFNVLELDWVVDLLERIRPTQADGFSCALSALYAGDHLVAAHLGVASDDVLHFWFPAFDWNYGKYSPGSIMLLALARAAAGMGIKRLELGRGREHYKSRFESAATPVAEGVVDARPSRRLLRKAWLHTRERAAKSRLAVVPRRIVQRFRNRR